HPAGIASKKIEGHYSKTADDPVGLVEAEPDGIGTRDHGVSREGQGHLERREPPADSTIALAGLCDGDSAVVQRNPGAFVDLHAYHVGVAQTVDLDPQRADLARARRRNLDGDTRCRAVLTHDLDRKSHSRPGRDAREA